MKQFLSALALVILSACGPISPPDTPDPVPTSFRFSVVVTEQNSGVFVTGVQTQVDGTSIGATNLYGFAKTTLAKGTHTVHLEKSGYVPRDLPIDVTWHLNKDVELVPTAPPTLPLSTSAQIFLQGGHPWRYKGVTAFKLARIHADGQSIDKFLEKYAGFNVLRIFDYVTWKPDAQHPNAIGWESPSHEQTIAFVRYVGARGWYVEVVLLTDDDPARIEPAKQLVESLKQAQLPNVVLEAANEPDQNGRTINVQALKSTLENSGFLYSSGNYDPSNNFYGLYLTAHTPRDSEWPRKAHDLYEYYVGGGPGATTDIAHKVPAVGDEPLRPDEAQPPPVGNRYNDFLEYFATASLLGAGATFHCESCKYGTEPNSDEQNMAAAALEGLNKFPPDAPLGPYIRIDEHGATLRTYKVGPYTVRIRPVDWVIFP